MKRGRYCERYKDFDEYRSPFFKPADVRPSNSCGWDTFLLITGKYPIGKFGQLTTDKKMVMALEKEGVTVIPLSICSVTNRYDLRNLVSEEHVVLISQMFRKNEGSWCVLHNGEIYHNCTKETDFFHMLEFINRPILTAYILWKKDWSLKPARLRPVKFELVPFNVH
jgi:hypothetical protein